MRINNTITAILLATVTALFLAACEKQQLVEADKQDGTYMLLYEEEEPGTGTYPVRVFITPAFIRFDDGLDEGDYLLLDRSTRTAFSVVHDDASILVLDVPENGKVAPRDIRLEEKRSTDADAPLVAGSRPVTIDYLADGERCLQAVVVPGFLKEAADALAEYARLLGDRQLRDLSAVPDEMRTGCFMARYIFHADRHLLEGLPLQEWDGKGYRRSLVGFEVDPEVAGKLLLLPGDYSEIRIGGPG